MCAFEIFVYGFKVLCVRLRMIVSAFKILCVHLKLLEITCGHIIDRLCAHLRSYVCTRDIAFITCMMFFPSKYSVVIDIEDLFSLKYD